MVNCGMNNLSFFDFIVFLILLFLLIMGFFKVFVNFIQGLKEKDRTAVCVFEFFVLVYGVFACIQLITCLRGEL